MGAVFQVGPPEQSPAFVLLAIADNADDFGFACPSHETIAAKARCDRRTVIRQIEFLEREGWLKVVRKIVNGKSNAYFLNLAKLGVTVSPDARRSPLHSMILKRNGAILSRIFAPKMSSDTKKFSGDNPQPPQVTNSDSQVTFEGGSSDTRSHLNLLTVIEPSREPATNVEVNPTLPSPAGRGATLNPEDWTIEAEPSATPDERAYEVSREDEESWEQFRLELKSELHSISTKLKAQKKFQEIRPGQTDYAACFDQWWLLAVSRGAAGIRFITSANDEKTTERGLNKYPARLERLVRLYFGVSAEVRIHFEVKYPPATLDIAAAADPGPPDD